MNLEEAKQLKPGDCVLLEAIVRNNDILGHTTRTIDAQGNMHIFLKLKSGEKIASYINPENIREKLARSRRQFKKGDIVLPKGYETPFMVTDDEEDGVVNTFLKTPFDVNLLTLICAVEDRCDRKEKA